MLSLNFGYNFSLTSSFFFFFNFLKLVFYTYCSSKLVFQSHKCPPKCNSQFRCKFYPQNEQFVVVYFSYSNIFYMYIFYLLSEYHTLEISSHLAIIFFSIPLLVSSLYIGFFLMSLGSVFIDCFLLPLITSSSHSFWILLN